MANLLLPDHPPDTVDNIALPTAIGTDNARDALVEADKGFISKTLKSLYFKAL